MTAGVRATMRKIFIVVLDMVVAGGVAWAQGGMKKTVSS
jgi:hypothetical protein